MGILPPDTTCEQLNLLAGAFDQAIDFYFWQKIPCFRLWPRWNRANMSPDQVASAAAFQETARRKKDLLQEIKDAYITSASGSTYTWGDLFTALSMEYYNLTGELPPKVKGVKTVKVPGIKTITLRFSTPCRPVLKFFRKNKTLDFRKKFRGVSRKCRKPVQDVDLVFYPMELTYTRTVPIPTPVYPSYSRVYDQPSSLPCAAAMAAACLAYAGVPEEPVIPPDPASVFQSFRLLLGLWRAVVTGSRFSIPWTPHVGSQWELVEEGTLQIKEVVVFGVEGCFESFGGQDISPAAEPVVDSWFEGPYDSSIEPRAEGPFTVEDFNGVLVHFSSNTQFFPDEKPFRCVFGGSSAVDILPGNFDRWSPFPSDLREGVPVHTSILHPDYYIPSPYPVCAIPGDNKTISASLDISELRATVGPRWEYTWTFPHPVKKEISIFCGFLAPDGECYSMYPVYVWPGQISANRWASLLLQPYDPDPPEE